MNHETNQAEPEDDESKELKGKSKSNPMLAWLVIAALFGGFWYLNFQDIRNEHRNLLQNILDDNISRNTISIDYVSLPSYTGLPFAQFFQGVGLLPSEYAGYFSMANKDGSQMSRSCEASTIDFSIRLVGGNMFAAEIDGVSMMKVRACR